MEDGLPQSFISGIVQDKDGFLWLATLDGLCSYDGRKFSTHKYNESDPGGLSSKSILGFAHANGNTVNLIYSPESADVFDFSTRSAKPNDVFKSFRDMPNALWQNYRVNDWGPVFAYIDRKTGGIGWFDPRNGKFFTANVSNGLLKEDSVLAVTEDASGRLVLIHRKGIHRSTPDRKLFEWIGMETGLTRHVPVHSDDAYGEYFDLGVLPDDRVVFLQQGKMVILDWQTRIATVKAMPPAYSTYKGFTRLQLDRHGNLYFNYFSTIYTLRKGGELVELWRNNLAPHRLTACYIDRSDVLWLSEDAAGLLKIDLLAPPFETYNYSASFMLDMLSKSGVPESAFHPGWRNPMTSYFFRHLRLDDSTLIYLSNRYDLFVINQIKNERNTLVTAAPHDEVYGALAKDDENNVWLYAQANGAWYKWTSLDKPPVKYQVTSPKLNIMDAANAVYASGFLWVATPSNGLYRYKPGDSKMEPVEGNEHGKMPVALTDICRDPANPDLLWIGSRGGGLIRYGLKDGLERIYTTRDNLPDNTIYCLLMDKVGHLWASTNRGIFRMNPANGELASFQKSDGLQGNEFNRAHKFTLPDGRFIFGGLEGYSIFQPLDFARSVASDSVTLEITSLFINNMAQGADFPGSLFPAALADLENIVLKQSQNYLRIEFAALKFNQPQRIRYRYQLTGVDETWVETGTSNVASYTGLAPGSYTLMLNCSDGSGHWSTSIRRMNITVLPPWYGTWWAYTIYALVLAGLLIIYLQMRERQMKTAQKLRFEQRETVRLRELDEIKDRFISNVTHEFRTPLTLVLSPLEKLMEDSAIKRRAGETLLVMQRNGNQLLRLVNEFLDLSKLRSGQMQLQNVAADLSMITRRTVLAFEDKATEKNIELSFAAGQLNGFYHVDVMLWESVLTNLLGNAMKFCGQGGRVLVELYSYGELVLLKVEDNGVGIAPEKQSRIFERFFQVDDSMLRKHGGTGIGLSLVKEIVELMKGTIQVESEPGKFSRFIVSVPLQPAIEASDLIEESVATNGKILFGGNKPVILVAEDNDELRHFLSASLSGDYSVLEASDGTQAWDTILAELPDFVISDVMMPARSGFELCRLCKTDIRTAHIGVLLLTAKTTHEARITGLDSGADAYLTKPFSLQELQLQVANLIQLQLKQRDWLQSQYNHELQDPQPKVTDPFLQTLYVELEQRFADESLDTDTLGRAMAMSRSTLNRKLKALLNTTAAELIRNYRLRKAAEMIKHGHDITGTAYAVGFSSPSYFSQVFKEAFGVSPSEYR